MDVTIIKKENDAEHIKVEEQTEQHGVATVVLQNISEFGEIEEQIVPAESIPYILKKYAETSDGNLQIAQVEDGQYTYIIENTEGIEEGAEYEFADGEHYIIEEYQENYEDESRDSQQFETVYIQHIESPDQEKVETTEVYTISEEIEGQYSEDDSQPDDDDQQMAIYEDGEAVEEEHVPKKKLIPTTRVEKKTPGVVSGMKKHTPSSSTVHKLQTVKQEDENFVSEEGESSVYKSPQGKHDIEVARKDSKESAYEENKSGKDDLQLIYECSICGKGFKTPMGVKRHISITHWKQEENKKENTDVLSFSLCHCCGEPSDSAHTTGDFKCDICDKLFIQQNSLDRHVSIEHPDGDNYVCYDCKKGFKAKEQLIEHTRVHLLKSVKCDDCGREFSRKYHLDRHIGQTGCMGVPKQVYECWVCSKSFTRKDNLAEHLKAHAGIMNRKKKKFTCDFCMKEFNGLALLNIHVRTHTGERPYACDICEKRFPSSGAMKKHRRMHTGEKPYKCSQCGNKFAAKETLNRHWRTHTGEKPHQCKYCGKSFIQAAQLRAHIFHHTGENAYTCPHCSRAFNRKLRLTTHIKFMHEGAEPLNCPQEGCNKTFFRKEDIHRHMLTHSGEKPYECDVCGKAFVVKSSLKIHQLTHRKEAPVTCEVCNRAFIRQDCLMRHMRARHRDVLEDIVANAEKKRLQKQLLHAVASAANKDTVKDTIVWNEYTLTESIKELLYLLVDEECLSEFGHPEAPVDKVLESVIKRCGHTPASEADFDYIGKMRENAKLLFTVVIDDHSVKELLNNQTVDEVIMHVLKLAKKQSDGTLVLDTENNIDEKPNIEELSIAIDVDEDSQDTLTKASPRTLTRRTDDRIEYVVENPDSLDGSVENEDEDNPEGLNDVEDEEGDDAEDVSNEEQDDPEDDENMEISDK